MKDVTLWQGDCLDLMDNIPDGSVDMVLADLPYGTTRAKWDAVIAFEPLWKHYKRVIKPRGAVVLFGAQPFASALGMSNPRWLKEEWIWVKSKVTGHLNAKRKPLKNHENILVFYQRPGTFNPQMVSGELHARGGRAPRSRGNETYNAFKDFPQVLTTEYYPRTVLFFPCVSVPKHPNEKPVPLLEYLLHTYTNAGDTVLDNTFGSCSTGEACLNTNRRFIGIERDPHYFQEAVERLAAVRKRIEAAQGPARQLELIA